LRSTTHYFTVHLSDGFILRALEETDSILECDSKVSTRYIEDIGIICTIRLKILYPF